MIEKKKRDINYELIRLVAMLGVIFCHVSSMYIWSDNNSAIYQALDVLFCTCNALFFLLAGRFAFKVNLEDKTKNKQFYWKKIIGLIIPILVYMAIKNYHVMAYNKQLEVHPKFYLTHLGIAIVNGFNYMEYWFLYTLIPLLIAVPFTARMIQGMKEKDKKAFFIVGIFFSTLTTFIPLLGVNFAIQYIFIGHILLFHLGYFIEDLFKTKTAKRKLYIAGLISFAINIALILVAHYFNGYKSTSPFYIIFGIAFFIFIRDKIKVPKKAEKLVLFLGKHSLAVYMLHFMVLYTIHDITNFPQGIIGFVCVSALCLLASSIIGAILDSTIIKWLQTLTIKIFRLKDVVK